jgi:methionine-rich copper-binding protein CopC
MCAIMDWLLAAPAEMWLTDGAVDPIIGSLATPFTYTVTYTQINDVAPTVQNVVIDGSSYAMTDPTGGAGPYSGGVVFTYVHTFGGGGDHEFHFEFSDGTNSDRLPSAGELWGPMNGYYFFDFESGDGGFMATGPADDWEYGMPTAGPGAAHSGDYCWGTVLAGNYNNNSQSRLETPSLDFTLGGGDHLELKFWHFVDSEGSYSPYDGGNVKLILPDTAFVIYPDLALADDYDTYAMSSSNAWIPNEAAYFGPVSGWKEAIFDLTPWTTESDVVIAFDFGSDGSVSTYDGWYIDDVVIWGYPPLPVELSSFAATAGDRMVTLAWETRSELNNLGFELYRREADGEFVKITEQPIPGAGNSETAQTYAYVDRGLDNGVIYTYQLATVDFGGQVEMYDVLVSATPTEMLPTAFALSQNYPNPFNPNTEIKYQIPENSRVALKIYNVMGQEVVSLMDKDLKAGYYTATWDARNASGHEVSAGIYFCTMQAGEFSQTVKMVLLK